MSKYFHQRPKIIDLCMYMIPSGRQDPQPRTVTQAVLPLNPKPINGNPESSLQCSFYFENLRQ